MMNRVPGPSTEPKDSMEWIRPCITVLLYKKDPVKGVTTEPFGRVIV